jgi:hypothetical protein
MSRTFVAPARHPRLGRIVLTGTLLIAATTSVAVFGQSGTVAPAAASSVQVRSDVQPTVSERQLVAGAAERHAIVIAQQEQQAAAQAAAAAAAQAAAAAAQAAAAANAARSAAAAASSVTVWTAGWQAEINVCRGAVDITAHYGTRTVAQHWGCGGSRFPTAAGAIVHFAGLDAGTYRVIGVVAVLNAYTAKTDQLPRGYDMLFQTCRNDDSHTTEFIALQKVG